MKRLRLVRAAFVFISLCAVFATARAHDPGLSVAEVQIRATTIELSSSFAPGDVNALLPESARRSGKWTADAFDATKSRLLQLAPELWEVSAGGHVVGSSASRVELAEKSDSLNFHLTFPRPAGVVPVVFRALKLDAFPSGHREYFTASDERGLLVEKLLFAKNPAVELTLRAGVGKADLADVSTPPPSFWGFLKLGVEHIWTGYDHLLFLFGLLLVCRTFKSIVAIISCFTLAHSLTLALATMNVVNLPSRFVEPMIAASIVFVGVENLLRRGAEPRGRWALTFAFGLIHGFGFASVLRDLGVGQDGRGLLMPLLTFNLGVEVGQIAVAAIVLPLIWRLRKNAMFRRRGVPALSTVVALAGLYWLLERTLFA
jgi:hydrogenase/urease accessory protein HupE